MTRVRDCKLNLKCGRFMRGRCKAPLHESRASGEVIDFIAAECFLGKNKITVKK